MNNKDKSESYAHFAAKNIFVAWLREAAKKSGVDNYANLGSINWRVNRGEPYWGVFEEYPLDNNSIVWDERQWWCNCKTQEYCEKCIEPIKNWPDYSWMCKNSKEKFKIADIVVQHKGYIAYIIEIIHKNDIDDDKIKFYQNNTGASRVYSIPTHWILGQIDIPNEIPEEFRTLW